MDERYKKNLPALSEAECLRLRQKKVCVAGCGGLGGTLIELLGRLGVGQITAVDGDIFTPSNLNRQLLCTESTLGQNKAEAARARMQKVNSDVRLHSVPAFLTPASCADALAGHDLVLDALDSPAARRMVAGACAQLAIPMVHGAISGWHAQVAVLAPGSRVLDALYPEEADPPKDAGSPAFTPAACAAWQAAEAVKLLCGRPALPDGRVLFIDLLGGQVDVVSV